MAFSVGKWMFFLIAVLFLCTRFSSASPTCSAWLVQSIPTDLPHLKKVPGILSTGDVFQWLAGNSTESLDLLVQYWQFLAQPENPRSGDFGYSNDEMESFGANVGKAVYDRLDAAAERGIDMRIIQHTGVYPDYDQESAALAASRPNVKNVTLLMSDWWGSGIVHAKVWISDNKDIYIGSANNDWKSLTQVNEVGIYVTNCPAVAEAVETYFENLWTLSLLNSSQYTKIAWDDQFQLSRKVPCWSHFLQPEDRCESPLMQTVETTNVLGYPHIYNPQVMPIKLQTPGSAKSSQEASGTYLSFSPPEVSFKNYPSDEQGWVDTILSAGVKGTVRITAMDWLGQSQYADATVYWSALSSAISQVVFAKNVTVKLMVAYWSHQLAGTGDYLASLNYTNTLCTSSKYNTCTGRVEIRYFKVPGYSKTGPKVSHGVETGNIYPGYSRVTHAKYVVSDVRAHIGTSNLVWDYFYTTSGVSFGTYNKAIVSQLQAAFEADWESPYTVPFDQLTIGDNETVCSVS